MNFMLRLFWLLFPLAAGIHASATSAAEVDPAVTRIRAFYEALTATMKDADRLGARGRYDELAPAVRSTFDLAAMTRISVGPAWTGIASDEQKALIEAFSRMTIATYANRFDGYSGERFDVDPAVETRSSGKLVHTTLTPPGKTPIALNYLFRESAGEWKAVDVYLNGTISELATRRSEFGAILKSGGAKALVESLRQSADKLLAGG